MSTIKFEAPNLSEMIEKSLAKNLSEKKLQEIINKCCYEVVSEAIKDQFSYGGKIKKQLKEFIKDKTNINTDILPIPEFTNLVAEGFKNALKGLEDEKIRKEAEKLLESIIDSAPKEIKLSELAKKYIDEISDRYDYELRENQQEAKYDGEEVYKTFELEYTKEDNYPESSCLQSYKTLTFECSDIKDNAHRLLLSIDMKENGNAKIYGAMRDKKYSPSINEMDMKDWSKASELTQLLYKMANSKTEIIMDEKDVPEEFYIKLEAE